ncbi:nucleolar protein [Trifolium repens]|nr:nucleolar protein [Trifolium repens]
MDSLSRFTNHLCTPTIFILFTCVSPNHCWTTSNNHNQSASNQIIVPMPSSLINTPRKIFDKIIKAIHYQILKMKKKEDQDKCLWKKTILMGEKCQPLEFPGAIFYDSEGNQLSEPPRTPRTSHDLISFGHHLS